MNVRRTQQAHDVVASRLASGDCAIDATAGNGHDTLFLARQVGIRGTVFGFDVQSAAVAATRRRLLEYEQTHNEAALGEVTLYEDSHENIAQRIPRSWHGRVQAIMFNLGYLPGGDHRVTTRAASTLKAVAAAGGLLAPNGVVCVLAYPGHPAGREELQRLTALMAEPSRVVRWQEHEPRAAPETAPRLFIGERGA